MSGILEQEEFSELLHEHGETAEVQAFVEDFFSPEMMSEKIVSSAVEQYFESLQILLIKLEKDDAVKNGVVTIK